MSAARKIASELFRFLAPVIADAIDGKDPEPEALALELAKRGIEAVGHEGMKRLLTQAAADRINAEIDAEG